MQLVAYGAQDIYLTGNPQITFFKVVYRRHTNFSMETIKQTLDGASTASVDATSSCTISRNGDLVSKVYVTAPVLLETKGSALIKEVELEIGGQLIDRHYQEWNDVWNELTTPTSKALGLKAMQCEIGTGGTSAVATIQLPLNFWFCRNPGLALPLIALQYHEVKIKFTWGATTSSLIPSVWCDYIYLDTDERRRFAQVSHEYLIEQLQKESKTISATGINETLNFNHPVKELIWTYDRVITLNDGQLLLNGHDRFAEQKEEYFTLRQPFDYHTAIPHQNLPEAAISHKGGAHKFMEFTGHKADGIYTGHGPLIGDIDADGNLLIEEDLVVFEGAGAPGFTSAYTGPFHLAIVPISDNGDGKATLFTKGDGTQLLFSCTIGTPYFVEVVESPTAAKVTVTSNKIAFVTEGYPKNLTGLNLRANNASSAVAGAAEGSGTFRIFQASKKLFDEHAQALTSRMLRKIGVYSFALKPEEHQPSGTCNFSRIDNAKFKITANTASPPDADLNFYAVNYNVLRIMSGMGGLAYSN